MIHPLCRDSSETNYYSDIFIDSDDEVDKFVRSIYQQRIESVRLNFSNKHNL